MFFLQSANEGSHDSGKYGSRRKRCMPYVITLSSPAFQLVVDASICAILDGFSYDIATPLMVWEVMRSADWLEVTLEPVAQLLLFFLNVCNVLSNNLQFTHFRMWSSSSPTLLLPRHSEESFGGSSKF